MGEDEMRKLAAGNWKMNGTTENLREIRALADAHPEPGCDILLCPPATLIDRLADIASATQIMVGGQDCHAKSSGAHTGDVSAAMLADAGATHVILGHSERRTDHGETDADVTAKVTAALAAGLTAIVCLGETLAEREAGRTIEVVERQLTHSIPSDISPQDLVVAYEPVWAIGTDRVPTTDQIAEVHAVLRARLVERFGDAAKELRLLYGGSVKPSNAMEIFTVPEVDGALVGGASLKAADFSGIISALESA
jgi:triosephosphate isomerase